MAILFKFGYYKGCFVVVLKRIMVCDFDTLTLGATHPEQAAMGFEPANNGFANPLTGKELYAIRKFPCSDSSSF